MDTRIARGKITPAAIDAAHDRPRADLCKNSSTDRIAIRAGASQFRNQIVSATRRFVPEYDARLVMVNDHEVEVAVGVEIAVAHATTHLELLEVRAGA